MEIVGLIDLTYPAQMVVDRLPSGVDSVDILRSTPDKPDIDNR